jgi:microcystin degradation protein MlrC
VIRTDDGLTVMLTTRRMPPFSLRQLTSHGIAPEQFQILVAKGANAPIAAYKEVCKHFIRVNTPGVTTADIEKLTYKNRRRPMFPWEREF